MKVLWFVNIAFPEVQKHLDLKPGASGWWLVELARLLNETGQIELTVANCSPRYCNFDEFKAQGIRYWMIPARASEIVMSWRTGRLLDRLAELVNRDSFDLIDVHGTEYMYGLITPRVNVPVLITIQGFMNAVLDKQFGQHSFFQVLRLQTNSLRDLKSAAGELYKVCATRYRARSERKVIACNQYFSGRTEWDHCMVRRLCPNLKKYFHADRILRSPFYKHTWNIDHAQPQRLFICSRCDIYKGIDDVIVAVQQLARIFPDIELRIAGDCNTYGWGGYLRRLCNQLGVQDRVHFLGILGPDMIVQELLHCNIYVHPSYVDNSPNALAEAMMVGVPCIASNRGGIPSLLTDHLNGLLFDPGDISTLILSIATLIHNRPLSTFFGQHASICGAPRNNPENVLKNVIYSYLYFHERK